MAAYFNRNLKILREALSKKKGRMLDFDYLAILLDFPAIKLQQWERDGEPTLAEARKLAEKYSKLLGFEITAHQLINKDLRYDERFYDIVWRKLE